MQINNACLHLVWSRGDEFWTAVDYHGRAVWEDRNVTDRQVERMIEHVRWDRKFWSHGHQLLDAAEVNADCEYQMWRVPLVVTRHPGLVDYLSSIGAVETSQCDMVEHATERDVAHRSVVGVLPINLAAMAASVAIVPLQIPAELRGIELDAQQVAEHAGPMTTYHVTAEGA